MCLEYVKLDPRLHFVDNIAKSNILIDNDKVSIMRDDELSHLVKQIRVKHVGIIEVVSKCRQLSVAWFNMA